MGLPPSDAGAVQLSVTWALPPVAATAVGAPGATTGATGVTLFDAIEGRLAPIALIATTVKVYVVPLIRPVPVAVVAGPVTVIVPPFTLDVTVYPVIGLPPSDDGAVQLSVAW